MAPIALPPWARTMKEIFRSGTVSQFVLTGNINDLVRMDKGEDVAYCDLRSYLAEVMFAPFDVVLFYDRGKGIRLAKGAEHFQRYLQVFDKFHGTSFATDADVQRDPEHGLAYPGMLPRVPEQALELIDRFLRGSALLQPERQAEKGLSVAVIIGYADFILPRGESIYLTGDIGANLIKVLSWATEFQTGKIVTVLLAENLADLHEAVVENPYGARIRIDLPDRAEVEEFLECLTRGEPAFAGICRLEGNALADRLLGLNRVCIRGLILRALRNNEPITFEYLARLRKEYIEKEAAGKLEFVESRRTLADVAGHTAAKQWLRSDAALMKKGAAHALPMGYLITGRIGTGKTYLVECFAGECGVPFVALKNFREKWVGATEGNLERIFQILHALGQVVVFVDEADQMTGRRGGGGEGDSGLSGRVYGMLAREMANTDNRGKILWLFATSRPDLLEVDLKRQGRLDVHIPLFPPESKEEQRELFLAMAKKLRVEVDAGDLPELNFATPVSGNELEGLLIRALRRFELQDPPKSQPFREILHKAIEEFRPSAHTPRLALMDLLAVKECTDDGFLPERYRRLDQAQLDGEIARLIRQIMSGKA